MSQAKLQIDSRLAGRALHASPDGVLYRSESFRILRSIDGGATWADFLAIPGNVSSMITRHSRIASRFLRHEVRAFMPLADGRCVAATRAGIFFSEAGQLHMSPAQVDATGRTAQFPTSLCAGPDGRVIWGEYWRNLNRKPMRLFGSTDGGRTYQLVHRFPAGEIRHVHGLLWDETLQKYWVFVGDHGDEPGMGLLDADWGHFEWLHKGEQRFRVVSAFDQGDHLLYATDTEKEGNGIYRLDKESAELTLLAETDGSCIYACRIGQGFLVSTSAEPRRDGAPAVASLWYSADGDSWESVYTLNKDRWQANLFQFGSLVLPRGALPEGLVMLSGQAVDGLDGELILASLVEAG